MKSVFIKKLLLKNFRSLRSEAVSFSNPVFVVGKNGAGKSNFVDAFAFLSDSLKWTLEAAFEKRGGIGSVRYRQAKGRPPSFGLGVEFVLDDASAKGAYAFEIQALQNYDFKVVEEQCRIAIGGTHTWFRRAGKLIETSWDFGRGGSKTTPALDMRSLALPLIGGMEEFEPFVRALKTMKAYSIDPRKAQELQEIDQGHELQSDGANLSSVLRNLETKHKGEYDLLSEFLRKIVPGVINVKHKKLGKKITMDFIQEWNGGKVTFDALDMSDGTLRVLGILAAVMQKPAPALIAIEEPEATIHPGALGVLLDIISEAASNSQIIMTTHSPDILDAKWIRPEHLRMAVWLQGATRISHLAESSKAVLREHLEGAGELMRSNALEPACIAAEGGPSGDVELFASFQ